MIRTLMNLKHALTWVGNDMSQYSSRLQFVIDQTVQTVLESGKTCKIEGDYDDEFITELKDLGYIIEAKTDNYIILKGW